MVEFVTKTPYNVFKMTDENSMICRLCLHIISDKDNPVQPLEKIVNIVRSILPTLNLNVSSNPIICSTCNESLQKSYKYKVSCLEALETKNKFYMEEMNHSKLSAGVVKEERVTDGNFCRFCSQRVAKDLGEFSKLEAGVMEICIPELDPSLIRNDVICEKCLHRFHVYYNFVQMCANVEETISNYCKAQDADDNGEVDLEDILEYSLKTDRYFDRVEIKDEKLEEDNSQPAEILVESNESIYANCLTKQEISIKDESEEYGTHADMDIQTNEIPKIESQEVPANGMDAITSAERSKMNKNKQLSARDPKIRKCSNDLQMFRCHNCTYQTKYKSNLTKHLMIHTGNFSRRVREEIRLQCTECTYSTTNKQLFRRHLIIHKDSSELQMFKCHNCSYQSKFKSSLAKHMLVHRDPTERELFMCSQCEYQTRRKMNLTKHIFLVHKDSFSLAMGGEKLTLDGTKDTQLTPDEQLLGNHMIHKHSRNWKMYKCHNCSYQTMYKHNLTHHMLVHMDPTELKMYKCNQCKYQSKRKNELIRHTMLIHKDDSLFAKGKEKITLECPKCTYQTTERYAFSRHLLVHKDSRDSELFKCHSCSFQTKFKHNLIQHMLKHRDPTKLEMFKCSQCEYQSKQKMGLKSHIMFVHKDSFLLARGRKKITLECLKCNYQTTEEHLLTQHLMVHKDSCDSQMFECHNCSFQTKFKSNLTKHMIVHRDPAELKMFKCSQCEYQAKRKRGLKSHIMFAHNGTFLGANEKDRFAHEDCSLLARGKEKKILECLKCNYHTTEKHLLRRHHLRVHRDPNDWQMFKCHNCSFQTKFKHNLIDHMLVHRDPTELEMFKCSQCKFQAKRKKGLTAHMWFTHNPLLLAREKEKITLSD